MSILPALLGLDGGGLFGGMFNPTTAKTGSAWTNPQMGGAGPIQPNLWAQLLAGAGQQSSGVKPPKPVKPGQGRQHGSGSQNARKAMSAVISSGGKGGKGGGGVVKPPSVKISRDYAKLRRRR